MLRRHIKFANVTSLLALFVALGGTSYGLATGAIGSREISDGGVTGRDIRNRTITNRDIRRNGLGGTSVKESRLGTVPRARNAFRVGGRTAAQLRVACPSGTRVVADACVEETTRASQPYAGAEGLCRGGFRRLASYEEVNGVVAFSDIALSPEGELTANVFPSSSDPQRVNVLVVTNEAGAVTVVPDTNEGSRPFRCALDPTN